MSDNIKISATQPPRKDGVKVAKSAPAKKREAKEPVELKKRFHITHSENKIMIVFDKMSFGIILSGKKWEQRTSGVDKSGEMKYISALLTHMRIKLSSMSVTDLVALLNEHNTATTIRQFVTNILPPTEKQPLKKSQVFFPTKNLDSLSLVLHQMRSQAPKLEYVFFNKHIWHFPLDKSSVNDATKTSYKETDLLD